MPASVVRITIPGVYVQSEANKRGHWSAAAKRKAKQRETVRLMLCSSVGTCQRRAVAQIGFPLEVTIVRVAPRLIKDDDNLAAGCKAVRDEFAAWLGVDDGDKRVTYRYEQRKASKTAAVVFEVRKATTIEEELEYFTDVIDQCAAVEAGMLGVLECGGGHKYLGSKVDAESAKRLRRWAQGHVERLTEKGAAA